MSAGTMISLSCKSIVMGKQSSLGPIDPQMGSISANRVVAEFKKAHLDITKDPKTIPLWRIILSKYPLAFTILCEDMIKLSKNTTEKWLQKNMFNDKPKNNVTVKKIINCLIDHEKTLSHSRHIPISECEEMGLKIEKMEDKQEFQDAIFSIHYAANIMLSLPHVVKIITSQNKGMFATVRPSPR